MDDSLTIQQQQQKQSLLFNNKAFYSQASWGRLTGAKKYASYMDSLCNLEQEF